MRVFNFSAGPAMLPTPVMERARDEFLNYHGVGNGIMELTHRGPQFEEVIARAEKNIRDMMQLSDEYVVLFIQGGASLQFAMVPMNIMLPDGFAEYAETGTWSTKALKEAKLFGDVRVIASSKSTNFDRIPEIRHWKPAPGSSYLHITSNNTIAGTQYHVFPEMEGTDVPLVADMSSDIMSRIVDVNSFGLIYAGAQKNLGPSGVTLVIMRKDLAERTPAKTPTMLRYDSYIKEGSMYNTPPTFSIYMLALVTDWMKESGGLETIQEINDAKSEALYEKIDSTEFYRCPVNASNRSKMNVVFRLPSEDLEKKFVKETEIEGMIGLKGHRSVGGIRASIYNAMPMAGVEKLIDFMNEFERVNG
jgi:phosphoserine aminotransferase